MKTEHLIDLLSENVAPAQRNYVGRTLAWGLVSGVGISLVAMLSFLHLRPDLHTAATGLPFWEKFAYTLSFALLGYWIVERQARAGADARTPIWLLSLPVTVFAVIAVQQLSVPGADKHALLVGATAKVCTVLIVLLAVPIFVGVFAAMRQLAPTRLTFAGTAAGLLAGAASATVYNLHCPENTAPFIVVWYTLGILAAAASGAMVGRWALRW